jgi:hypothetical protein
MEAMPAAIRIALIAEKRSDAGSVVAVAAERLRVRCAMP